MNNFLIPANTKRGQLIFSIFRPVDLIIFAIGLTMTLILLAFFQTTTAGLLILTLLPAAIAAFLVLPIPNYHNMRIIISEIWQFYTTRQKFVWKGWCFQDGEDKK